jgi:hypothetical protein
MHGQESIRNYDVSKMTDVKFEFKRSLVLFFVTFLSRNGLHPNVMTQLAVLSVGNEQGRTCRQ